MTTFGNTIGYVLMAALTGLASLVEALAKGIWSVVSSPYRLAKAVREGAREFNDEQKRQEVRDAIQKYGEDPLYRGYPNTQNMEVNERIKWSNRHTSWLRYAHVSNL